MPAFDLPPPSFSKRRNFTDYFRHYASARYCGDTGAGAYQADAVQTGITRLIVGAWSPDGSAGIVSPIGNVTVSTESTTSGAVASTAPLRYLVDIKQRTADKTRPENIALPVALYLGQPAEI